MSIIVARQLRKRFDSRDVVNGIDLEVRPGECFGLLGPNGAGKTTTIRMIYGSSPKTSGELRIFDLDIDTRYREIRAQIGVVPQENNLDPDLTVLENLLTYARYFSIPAASARQRAEELLEFVQLADRKESKISEISGGMKRRLILARALINRPRLLILDEPTTGLDPQARLQVWQKLRELKQAGTTMVLTTHYMEDANQLCDRIALMDFGHILVEGAPQHLVEQHVGSDCLEVDPVGEASAWLGRFAIDGAQWRLFGGTFYIYPRNQRTILERFKQSDYRRLIHRPTTLEDLFLELTGRDFRE